MSFIPTLMSIHAVRRHEAVDCDKRRSAMRVPSGRLLSARGEQRELAILEIFDSGVEVDKSSLSTQEILTLVCLLVHGNIQLGGWEERL